MLGLVVLVWRFHGHFKQHTPGQQGKQPPRGSTTGARWAQTGQSRTKGRSCNADHPQLAMLGLTSCTALLWDKCVSLCSEAGCRVLKKKLTKETNPTGTPFAPLMNGLNHPQTKPCSEACLQLWGIHPGWIPEGDT